MHARALIILTACSALAVPLAFGQESKKEPIDPTPPPLGTASFEPPEAVDQEPLTGATFVIRAALAHMTEIELGELALARSKDPGIQGFARRMVTDHRKSLEHLKRAAAAESGLALPGTLDEKRRKLKQSLSSLQGKEFDAAYAKAMADGHDEAVSLFDAASHAEKLPDPVHQYASSTLPVVREHRDAAHELHAAQAKSK
jgi:putative membrane protein